MTRENRRAEIKLRTRAFLSVTLHLDEERLQGAIFTVSRAKRTLIRTSRILFSPCPPSYFTRCAVDESTRVPCHDTLADTHRALEITESSGCDGAEIAIVSR